MTKARLQELDRSQKQIMRRIVRWRRMDNAYLTMTITPMKDRPDQRQRLLHCEPWSIRFARNQWRYTLSLVDAYSLFWTRTYANLISFQQMIQSPTFFIIDLPIIHQCYVIFMYYNNWSRLRGRHWFDILWYDDLPNYENGNACFINLRGIVLYSWV